MKKILLTLSLLILIPQAADARDHQELVCSGMSTPNENNDSIPLFIHYINTRAKDGTSRNLVLSTIYQNRLYQGTYVNKNDTLPTDAPMILKANKQVRFHGKFTILPFNNGYKINVSGKLMDDPTKLQTNNHQISIELPCIDLSI